MKSNFENLTRIMMALLLLALAHSGMACGGDDKSLCEQNGEALCAEACACGGADGCVFGDADGSFSFDNEADCQAFMITLGCSGDDGSLNAQFRACLDDIDTGMCMDTGDGVQGYVAPASCDL